MGMPDNLMCPLRNLYAGQEATIRTLHRTTDWFQIGNGVHQGCILSPSLFNLYAEWNFLQAGIKIAGRNTNNLRYADDTTLTAENEEELKSLLMKMKEENVKAGLKLNIQKTKIMTSGPITSWQISSIQFSLSVVSDSSQPQGLQHARLPCPSLTPRACSNSCPSSQWCHPTISSSIIPFPCLQSFPESGFFLVSQVFTSGGQRK